jgi:hypothetical protein
MAGDKTKDFESQAREMLRAQQDAFLAAVKAWRESVAKGAEAPAWPKPPPLDLLPSPTEAAEASYAFAAKVLADQSRFMEALSKAMGKTEKKN